MVNLFNEIQSFLSRKEKLNFNFIIFLAVLTSFLEMISVAAIIPLVKIVLGNNDFFIITHYAAKVFPLF